MDKDIINDLLKKTGIGHPENGFSESGKQEKSGQPDTNAAAIKRDEEYPEEELDETEQEEYKPKNPKSEVVARRKADLVITLEHSKSTCFCMQQNDANIISSLSVLNNTSEEINNIRLKITSSPQFFEPLFFSLDKLGEGVEYNFPEAKPALDYEYLSQVTERVKTDIIIESEIDGVLLKTDNYNINILAFDEWPGMQTLPELIAAFSTPRDPAVNGIISEAAQLLKDEGLNFNGYQSGNPNVVNKQIAAIYSVIKARNIAYSMPPASFEQQGQKIRLPKTIIDLGLGTCLDTTMLMCSCAEAVGINPLIFIYNGHAFPGFWLKDSIFPEIVNDDLSSVKKRIAGGMNEITSFESTMLTDKKTGYAAAQSTAKERIDNGAGFICYIDIARARKSGILPLPIRYEDDGKFYVDREMYEASVEEVKNMRVVDVEVTKKSLSDRLEKWKRDLLDISLRNPLLNYKINKAGVPLLNYNIEAVEDEFSEGKQLQILPHPNEIARQITDITKLSVENDKQLLHILQNDLNNGILRTSLKEDELTKRLTALYRGEKLSVEENGASTLYLALGFLKWQEKDKPNTDRFAPIVLLPMQIIRKSARAGFNISMTEDELQINLSLIELLRVNFKIDASGLSELPEGEKGIDITKIFTYMRKLIIDQKGWDIIESASLGTFHFSKFVLWNDLNMREERLRSHPLTSGLISAQNNAALFKPAFECGERLYLPLASDSSQTLAARAAAQGKTFVLHGPPGTGKSQTITNIIGNALAHNKRVLFVAEKMAALNVVKRRLEKLGLFDFCLELHSNKSQKRSFYEQFDRLLELAQSASDVNFDEAAKKLSDSSAELEAFNKAMHAPKQTACSVYSGIGKLLDLSEGKREEELLEIANTAVTKDSYEKGLDILRLITEIGAAAGEPVNSAFYGCGVSEYSLELRDNVNKLTKIISDAYPSFAAALTRLSEAVRRRKKEAPVWNYDNVYALYVCLGEILYYKNKNGFIKFMAAVFSKRYKKMRKSGFYSRLKKFVKANSKENPEEAVMLYEALNTFLTAENTLNGLLKYERPEPGQEYAPEIYSLCELYRANISALRDYCIYNSYRKQAAVYPQLAEIIESYHNGNTESGLVLPLFERSFWQSWLLREVSSDPVLNVFSPNEYAVKRDRYRVVTELVAKLTQKEIYLKLAANLPNFKYASMSSSEPGILLKAVKSRGRGITIRQLLKRIPALMAKVKPCMLMSPLSAAQFLPEDFPEFDIIVFDEASQLLTSEAVGAISRGKSTIVVGDPKQLPPTTFFSSKADNDETLFEMQDLESLLDDMLTLNVFENRLLWHYRSEHESLIAFSNANYYENKLITFPSPDDARSRVQFKKVDGVYERGTTRTNPKEAEEVVDELFKRLKDPEKSRLSYGIVTFNVNQQTLIEDLIDKRLMKEPSLEKYFSSGDEPVFVKNIESVQGDERDVIFFSVTYGLDKEGKMTVNFGPVNKEGGWRRLNVAITRACRQIVVFSTITPDMIDLSRTSSKGVKGLKDFMYFAINGRTYVNTQKNEKSGGAFVSSVAEALRSAGYNVVENLGRSVNKIDIAVTDDNGKYILGILCDRDAKLSDGVTDDLGVKDREYGCENVLKNMGWKLTRIYALEWWQNPEDELKRIIDILKGKEETAADPEEKEKIEAELAESHKEIAFDSNIPLPVKEYRTIELPQNTADNFYLYNNINDITNQIREVIKAEAPVTEQRLFKTMAAAWDITRMTQKYTEYITQIIKRLNPVTNMTQNTKFYWDKKEDTEMQYFRNQSDRKADEIPKEEYAVAAYYIMQNALSISHEDLVRETAKLFGYQKTPIASVRIGYALSLLTIQGKIRKEDDIYKIK